MGKQEAVKIFKRMPKKKSTANSRMLSKMKTRLKKSPIPAAKP